MIGWLNGLTSGFSILVAQHFGAKKYDRMRHYIAMSIFLCILFVVVMTAALEYFNYPILRLMNAPEEIIGDVGAYMAVIYAGLAVTAAYNALAAVLRALGDGKSPLYFLIISGVLNVVLDVVFIVYFHMGVVGCGYATVIAQAVSALLCLIYIIRKFDILRLSRQDFSPDLRAVSQLLGFGAVYIAGFSAAGKIQSMVSTIFVSFGATIATYVGQNRGAGNIERVHQGVKVTQILVLVWSAVMITVIHFTGPYLVRIFVDGSQTDVLNASMVYFKTVAWCYPFLGSIFLYRNALQGLGYGLVPMLGGVFELAARFAVVAAVVRPFGYVGVCFADPAAWLAALVPIVPYYFYRMRKYRPRPVQH